MYPWPNKQILVEHSGGYLIKMWIVNPSTYRQSIQVVLPKIFIVWRCLNSLLCPIIIPTRALRLLLFRSIKNFTFYLYSGERSFVHSFPTVFRRDVLDSARSLKALWNILSICGQFTTISNVIPGYLNSFEYASPSLNSIELTWPRFPFLIKRLTQFSWG